MKITFLFLAFISPALAETHDLVIYGGTSAGIAAAVQAKRMGISAIVIEPTNRVGGLTTGGLGQTDIGNKQVIGGIAREFYHDIYLHYQKPDSWKWQPKPEGNFKGTGQTITAENENTQWTFEPSAALKVYHDWIERDGIKVVYNQRLDRTGESKATDRGDGYLINKPGTTSKGVSVEDGRITSITMESGETYSGKMFIDATYEGDLLASAGATFTVGREGEAVHGETLNGVQTRQAKKHNFVKGVDPYITPGDPKSGLLKWIDPEGPGKEHASDHRMQAYCFRMCLTNHPDNRIPFAKPEGYDETDYELLFRNFEAGFNDMPWINSAMPNRKTDTNNREGFSTDFIGQNYEWPQGSYTEREEIRERHLKYQKGLMWSLANHPRIPENVRKQASQWGMTKDEFTEGDGWQQQIYVREGRRLVGDLVMTQHHCQRRETADYPVGMGAYTMDSHNVQRYVDMEGHARNEGDVQVGGFPPYPVGYRSIVPKKDELKNLLVPVSLSASHISFGSIRMEPVFMILGQSAATAAAHAISENVPVQEVDTAKLRERLLADKQVLEHAGSAIQGETIPVKDIEGAVVDDQDAELTGDWKLSDLAQGIGTGYHHDGGHPAENPATATFRLKAPADGDYSVQLASIPNENRSTKVRVSVKAHADHTDHTVNQRNLPPVDKRWFPLTDLDLVKGQEVLVIVSNEGGDGYTVIDAVRLLPLP